LRRNFSMRRSSISPRWTRRIWSIRYHFVGDPPIAHGRCGDVISPGPDGVGNDGGAASTGTTEEAASSVAPGRRFAGGAVETELYTRDLAPTILDFFRVGAPATFEGKSVLPLRSGLSAMETTAR